MEQFVGVLVLLVASYVTGSAVERRHFKTLDREEGLLKPIPIISTMDIESFGELERVELVSGNVVLGADFFRHKLSQLVSIFGGNIAGLERMLVRARREATIRLRKSAPAADALADVRYETCMINEKDSGKLPIVEIYAYGTAVYFRRQ